MHAVMIDVTFHWFKVCLPFQKLAFTSMNIHESKLCLKGNNSSQIRKKIFNANCILDADMQIILKTILLVIQKNIKTRDTSVYNVLIYILMCKKIVLDE
jgi:hypothetical protein